MPFTTEGGGGVSFGRCSPGCILDELRNREPDGIYFAGFSKGHNKALRYGSSFYLERMASNWDGARHDFGVTVERDDVVRSGVVLERLARLHHPNLLKVKGLCDCSVSVEFIEGCLLNAKKQVWYVGPHAFGVDYGDQCTASDLLRLCAKVGEALLFLHANGICHTDPTDHNVMVSSASGEPILIDLIGAIPHSAELERLDVRVFKDHLLVPMTRRLGVDLGKDLEALADSLNDHGLRNLVSTLYDRLK